MSNQGPKGTSWRWRCALLGACCLVAPLAHAAHDDFEMHAYVNDACVIADEPYFVPQAADQHEAGAKILPLIGLVVGQLGELLVKHGIDAAASHLKAHAERRDTRYALAREMNLYRADLTPSPSVRINGQIGCLTIVAATLEPASTHCAADYVPKTLAPELAQRPQSEWRTTRTDDSVENQLRRADICVHGKARAVYEARFEFSDDGTAYRLKDAGYRIESLLTTRDKGATRTALYTLKISTPGATDEAEVLSSAWVELGTVSAGAHSSGSGGEAAPWLRVPPLSREARRVYEEKTKTHQEVTGEIEALRRAMTRNRRMQAGLDARIAEASGEVADGLKQERTRLAVQYQTQSAELDARTAEYQDLPRAPLQFMPVTIEVAVTETESEKKAQLLLADLVGRESDAVASAAGSAATGLVSRGLKSGDVITDSPAAPGDTLEHARARYFDALIEAQTSGAPVSEEAQRRLAQARSDYDTARRAAGLEPIK